MRTERIKVEGMSCGHCVSRVEDALKGIDGVRVDSVEIGEVVVALAPEEGAKDAVLAAIESAGYTAV